MSEIRLVGTAHVSAQSVEDVKKAIDEWHPDIVAVELDLGRFEALRKIGREPTVDEVLELRNFNQLLIQWILSYLQRRIGVDVGVEPGAEMKAAIEEAEKRRITISLVDRDIRVTLLRFWQSLGIWGKVKMFFALLYSIAEVDEFEIDVEQMKDQSVIDMVMDEFRKFSPAGARSLIDERDAFIAHNLLMLKEKDMGRILAVVGAGHVHGIQRYLDAPATLPPVESLTRQPRSFPWGTIFGFAVTVLFLLLLAAIGFSGVGWNTLLYAFLLWVVIHGVLAAAFTLAAGGHPYSALTCLGVAWMTSLNPLLHVGWIAAAVEAKVRNPQVTDFRKIYEAETLTDMSRIPLFKVVLVAAAANAGSLLGTLLYAVFLLKFLIDPVTVISTGLHNMVAWFVGII